MLGHFVSRLCLGGALVASPVMAAAQIVQGTPNFGSGTVYREDPATALGRYLRMVTADPRNLEALTGAGRAALQVGDAQAAIGFYARAEAIAPRNGRVKAGLGSALVQLNQEAAAMRYFEEAVSLGVPEADIASDRGLAHDLRGSAKRAQRDYQLALKRGENPETTRRMALSLAISGERDAALALLDPLLRRQDTAAWRARAFVQAITGDAAGASKTAESVMSPTLAAGFAPFFRKLPSLRPGEKAAAVHFGNFPGEGRPMRIDDLFNQAEVAARVALENTPRSALDAGSVDAGQSAFGRAPTRIPDAEGQVSAMLTPRPTDTIRPGTRIASVATPRATPLPTRPIVAPIADRVVTNQPATTRPVTTSPVAIRSVASRPAATQPVAAQPVTTQPVTTQPVAVGPAATPSLPAASEAVRVAAAAAQAASLPPTPAPIPVSAPPTPTPVVSTPARSIQPIASPSAAAGVSASTSVSPSVEPARTTTASPGFGSLSTPATASPSAGGTRLGDVSATIREAARAPLVSTTELPPSNVASAEAATSGIGPSSIAPSIPSLPASTVTLAGPPASDVPFRSDRLASVAAALSMPAATTPVATAPPPAAGPRVETPVASAPVASAPVASAVAAPAAFGPRVETAVAAPSDATTDANGDSRVWVQIAGGADEKSFPAEWRRLRGKAPDLLNAQTAWMTPVKATNRLLVGPFASARDAQDFVNKLEPKGITAFAWTNAAGQAITKLATR